jgi:hypothetical protein
MVYDCPMTENQSVIEEIAMVNCGEKILKLFSHQPLTSGLHTPAGVGRQPAMNESGYSFFYS